MNTTARKPTLPQKEAQILFLLCWAVYFVSNLARLNYGAVMAEMLSGGVFTKTAAGLVSTGFFICYGAGQLVSGFVGDHVPPRWMVFGGVLGSGLANLAMGLLASPGAMVAAWCVNGFAQSAIWTPILRIIAEYFPAEYRQRACVNMSTTYPAAALVTYIECAAIVRFFSWRTVFFVTTALVAAVLVAWMMMLGPLEKKRTVYAELPAAEESSGLGAAGGTRFPVLLLALVCVSLAFQGALRDGVMTWVPAYLDGTFGIGSALSILSTTLLPVVNLAGIFAASALHRRCRNETLTAALLFAAATASALLLLLAGQKSLGLSLVSFSLITSSMMGINLMLVSFVPTYFVRWGRVAFVAGLVNAMVYVGSSGATYGIGAVADALGWNALLVLLLVVAAAGLVFCALSVPLWKRFLSEEAENR